MPRTILITGVSTGFGRAFAQAALAAGHVVIGTVRTSQDATAFTLLGEHAHAIILDVSDFAAIQPAVTNLEQHVGPIDILVNNAGYGHEGILEESPLSDLQRQFDVNVYGAVAMMHAVLPHMRARRAGHIINVTSMGGYVPFPGVSYYNGSKFALEGISGALAQEVSPFNIKVTALAPGGFRTDWAGRSLQRTPRSIPDYDASFDPLRTRRAANSGKQTGDPQKAAQAFLQLIEMANPPVHLLLGSDALRLVRNHLATLTASINASEALTLSTDAVD